MAQVKIGTSGCSSWNACSPSGAESRQTKRISVAPACLMRATAAAEELLPLVEKLPAELSRNWCKRAGLARALALEPEVLILDNPLHGLGATHRQWWLRFLDEIARERNLTVILATDDLRPWAGNDHYRFALLHEGLFLAAGHWPDLLKNHPHLARTLLAGADRETAQ